MKAKKASELVRITESDHLETLRRCGGFYSCPKDSSGNRLGPLVGYAGDYLAPDMKKKHFVGDVYVNFAKAEEFPHVLYHFARCMKEKLTLVLDEIDVFCGAALGGYDFTKMLGLIFDRRTIKTEKKVTFLATAESREKSIVIFGRHEVEPGDRIAIVEDVCNNFSTTDKLIALIHGARAEVIAIVCCLNRSMTVWDRYYSSAADGRSIIPVISLLKLPLVEYRQDDPFVSEDVARNNVVWDPKKNWPKLMAAMSVVKQQS